MNLDRIQALVFLGNRGRDYEATRHNAGWRVVDAFPWQNRGLWQKKFQGQWTTAFWAGQKLTLLLPETYMNLSGESARALGDYFRLAPASWLAVHDDIDLAFGEVKGQFGGGLGGHNGLRSLKQHWGTSDFFRLRIGVGRPARGSVADYVLGRFTPEEEAEWPRLLERIVAVLQEMLELP